MPTTAQTYIIGNWKMNGTGASLAAIDAIAARSAENGRTGPSLAICPPATLIERAAARAGVALAIGGQDCAPAPSGAHTGDLSAEMLRDAGARLVIVGHSERRADHGETDDIVRSKAEAALRAGLTAVVCVGETRAQRDAGDAEAVVGAQIGGSLPAAAGQGGVIVAYEPVWAIGTGLVAHERDIAAMHGFIREQLRAAFGTAGLAISILYGGSVKPDNARSILAVEEVNGALVGGASLKPEDFLAIAEAARA